MPIIPCCCCNMQIHVPDSVATSAFSKCPWCREDIELYRCFSSPAAAAAAAAAPMAAAPMAARRAPAAAASANGSAANASAAAASGSASAAAAAGSASGAAAAGSASGAAAAGSASAAAAAGAGLGARRRLGRPAAINTGVREKVFIPARYKGIINEEIALRIIRDNTARQYWIASPEGPRPEPTDGLGPSQAMWELRMQVLMENSLVMMDCRTKRSSAAAKQSSAAASDK